MILSGEGVAGADRAAAAPVAAADAAAGARVGDTLASKLSTQDPAAMRFLADCLHGVRCQPGLAAALTARRELAAGEAFVTPEGHWITRLGVAFFAPDSE